ncbi:helix-turn-helix domain-containing protein [Nonomuraea guangzhouensis]|uniref:Helix-turn-helix domain-containing protein n=1 Tax=Nonomuraea guangzhouensis TaxID=1291555 RepID=A0ABW4GXH8_9ACTN|nr:helix-turn-helix transcriptional regulator [Nonomuraea guangzhouensis]
MATLVLRADKFNAYRRLAGLDTDASLAQKIGVDPTTVYRVLNGRTAMSAKFIAGIVQIFGADLFADLFEIVADDLEEIA